MIINRSVHFIAIGSNVPFGGDLPRNTVAAALTKLQQHGWVIRRISRFFETPSFPPGSGPDFVNAVVAVATEDPPEKVLCRLHDIETDFNRRRDKRWGARTLDLDLIASGDTVLPNEAGLRAWMDLSLEAQQSSAPQGLLLPHPRIQDRAFVLVPLCDIAPDWQHPVLRKSARALLAELPDDDIAAIRAI
ncbi:MAG: 2-amino-4-hydroxy-6-hydroxymethyldihydropteridine diphosphokinase [Arenibacterium sp.]